MLSLLMGFFLSFSVHAGPPIIKACKELDAKKYANCDANYTIAPDSHFMGDRRPVPPSRQCEEKCSEVKTCKADKVLLPADKAYRSADGCNTCTCTGGENLACTKMHCVNKETPKGCVVGNVVIGYGEKYKSSDSCNTCTCFEEGLKCTKINCKNPAPEATPTPALPGTTSK